MCLNQDNSEGMNSKISLFDSLEYMINYGIYGSGAERIFYIKLSVLSARTSL